MRVFINKRRLRQLTQLLVCYLLGIFLFCTPSVNAQKVANSCRPQFVLPEISNVDPTEFEGTCEDPRESITTSQVALQELAQADVVYLGETHDRPADHKNQLQIIQELQRQNPKIAIAMEMFQRPYQGVLNRYLAGKLSEQELVEQSEYNQRWGFPWGNYAPILRFAKEKQLPVLALNTPTEVTRQVARAGLESLTPEQRQFIPPFTEIRIGNAEYRQLVTNAFRQHQHANHGYSANFEQFFLAQVLWDETMAERIAQFVKSNPDYQVVVLAGRGHIVYGYGIPSRVARRLQDKQLIQRSILLSRPKDTSANTNKPIADFIWEK